MTTPALPTRRTALAAMLLPALASAGCSAPRAVAGAGPLVTVGARPLWSSSLGEGSWVVDYDASLGVIVSAGPALSLLDAQGRAIVDLDPGLPGGASLEWAAWARLGSLDLVVSSWGSGGGSHDLLVWPAHGSGADPALALSGQASASFTGSGALAVGADGIHRALWDDRGAPSAVVLSAPGPALGVDPASGVIAYVAPASDRLSLTSSALDQAPGGAPDRLSLTSSALAASWEGSGTWAWSTSGSLIGHVPTPVASPSPRLVSAPGWRAWGPLAWSEDGTVVDVGADVSAILDGAAYTTSEGASSATDLLTGQEVAPSAPLAVLGRAGRSLVIDDGSTLGAWPALVDLVGATATMGG